jgi:hypothetical protein
MASLRGVVTIRSVDLLVSNLRGEVMVSNLFYIVVSIIGILFAGTSCLFGIFAVNKRIIKYIPAGVAGIASLVFLLKALYFSKGFEGIAYIIFAMISTLVFTLSLITALVMEFLNRKR